MCSEFWIFYIKVWIVIKFEGVIKWLEFSSHRHPIFCQSLHQVGEENTEDGCQNLAKICANLFTLQLDIFHEQSLKLLRLSPLLGWLERALRCETAMFGLLHDQKLDNYNRQLLHQNKSYPITLLLLHVYNNNMQSNSEPPYPVHSSASCWPNDQKLRD